MPPVFHIKRAYEAPSETDGFRVLVDRLWPRGVSKDAAHIGEWAKDLAPSNELREWFGHDPERWTEFRHKYKTELEANPAVKAFIKEHAHRKAITLVYAAKDEIHNNAVALTGYLENAWHNIPL